MMYLRLSIIVCACFLAACANPTTPNHVPQAIGSGPTSPAATPTPRAANGAPSPTVVVQHGQDRDAHPAPADTFWVPDQPKTLPPHAFGPLPPDFHPAPSLRIGTYELTVPLPAAPPTLDVYQVGEYPHNHLLTVGTRTIKDLKGWEFIPEYFLVQYTGRSPLGAKTPVTTSAQAEQ